MQDIILKLLPSLIALIVMVLPQIGVPSDVADAVKALLVACLAWYTAKNVVTIRRAQKAGRLPE